MAVVRDEFLESVVGNIGNSNGNIDNFPFTPFILPRLTIAKKVRPTAHSRNSHFVSYSSAGPQEVI